MREGSWGNRTGSQMIFFMFRFEIPSPALLSGTKVIEGEGVFIVCVVGD
jgi:hypothetical protein